MPLYTETQSHLMGLTLGIQATTGAIASISLQAVANGELDLETLHKALDDQSDFIKSMRALIDEIGTPDSIKKEKEAIEALVAKGGSIFTGETLLPIDLVDILEIQEDGEDIVITFIHEDQELVSKLFQAS